LFLVILICESSLFAQNPYNVSQFTHETLDFVGQPGKWRGNDWLKLGLITAGTALAMQVDQPLRDAELRNHRYYRSVPIEGGRIWGEWYTPAIVAGVFGLHGALSGNNSTKKVGFEVAQAVLYSEAITQTLKIAFGRARPFANRGAYTYQPFTFFDGNYRSLPGGHSTGAFAMSTVLSRNAHGRGLKVLAYVPAAATVVSRIYQDKHWFSDCAAGAAIGYVIADWIVDLHEHKESAVTVSSIYPFRVSIRF
jgi:membrane-associated phospholipid phosphatase